MEFKQLLAGPYFLTWDSGLGLELDPMHACIFQILELITAVLVCIYIIFICVRTVSLVLLKAHILTKSCLIKICLERSVKIIDLDTKHTLWTDFVLLGEKYC